MSSRNDQMLRKAVIPGTFDPITCGHMEVVRRVAKVFDEVVVGVASSIRKGQGPMFDLDKRVSLASEALKDLNNVEVLPFTGLLVDFTRECGAGVIVKGLRAVTDYEYEFQMSALNYKLDPDLEFFFVMSTPEYMYLSSSVVKEIAFHKGNVEDLVPSCVGEALQEITGCAY